MKETARANSVLSMLGKKPSGCCSLDDIIRPSSKSNTSPVSHRYGNQLSCWVGPTQAISVDLTAAKSKPTGSNDDPSENHDSSTSSTLLRTLVQEAPKRPADYVACGHHVKGPNMSVAKRTQEPKVGQHGESDGCAAPEKILLPSMIEHQAGK